MPLIKFLASPTGRWVRFIAGAVLIALGLYMQGLGGIVVAVIGAVPFFAAIFDVCVFAPLFGASFYGKILRG